MPTELLLDGFRCSKHCKYFKKCRKLCAPVAFMVKKLEYEPPKESQIPPEFESPAPIPWPNNEECTGTMAIKKYFLHHQSPKQIANELEVSVSYIYRTIRNSKKIIAENIKKSVHKAL